MNAATAPHCCSKRCLLGLSTNGAMDPACPNITSHASKHLSQSEFLHLVHKQVKQNGFHNFEPLGINGSRSFMFRITLVSQGYTMLAKGVEKANISLLQKETRIYRQLKPLQGVHIPVCLGSTSLPVEYNLSDCAKIARLLFLSDAGDPIVNHINPANETNIHSGLQKAMSAIHSLGVLHCDLHPHNILWDKHADGDDALQVIDFERSEVLGPNWLLRFWNGPTTGQKLLIRRQQQQGHWKCKCDKETAEAWCLIKGFLAGRYPLLKEQPICKRLT
ncbi:hypothetical protein MMC31_005076 [Peltigera leucophlebia]|nr:hypothetical protein [Peltigera leucophlebia]